VRAKLVVASAGSAFRFRPLFAFSIGFFIGLRFV
jgi:hypothetical protein